MRKTTNVKKTLPIAALFILVLAVAALFMAKLPASAEDNASGDYVFTASDVSAAPTGDFVHSTTAGDQTRTYSSFEPTYNELVLVNAPGGAHNLNSTDPVNKSAYLGGIFLINPDVADYTDFTFTLKFRATQWVNDSRWIGVMYRMNTDAETGLHSGYMLTTRVNGASSYTSNAGVMSKAHPGSDNGFNDIDAKNANFTNNFMDGKYHTITITMSGNTASHYVDGKKIRDANTSDQDANIDPRSSGGFALILSQVSINVAECTISRTVTPPATETAPETVINPDYKVTDFSTVAKNDWTVNHKGDAGGTTLSVNNDGSLNVNAKNAPANAYYGALMPVNPGSVYTDFTFEMEFKVNRSDNADRWIGIVYRTNFASEAVPVFGYGMNYRVSGRNAYTAIAKTRAANNDLRFNDDPVINAGGQLACGKKAPDLTAGSGIYHKLTITMQDNEIAKHYIDGLLIRDASTELKKSHIGGTTLTSGGIAVIINGMNMDIKSVKLTTGIEPPTVINDNIDDTVVSTYQNDKVKIVNAPTVVCDVKDKATLDSLSGSEKPSNAILRFNKDANIVAADGTTVLGSFRDVYAAFDHRIIPIVHISDEQAADAFITYINEVSNILDIAVMSDTPALVKKVRAACPRVRGIIEYSAEDFYTAGKLDIFNNIVGRTNANYATTAVVPQSAATIDNVRYIQARFKSVWVRPDSNENRDLFQSINSGALGVVSTDFGKVYDALETYPAGSFTRMPYNVAHRGKFAADNVLCENSLRAVEEAIACGATHLELDGHLTKDGHIVIMHDDTLNRTSTGTGKIADYTLEQIQQFRLKDGQKIPTLEEVFDILYKAKQKGNDIVFVFELKAGKTIAEKINSLLGTGEGQYDIRDNLVIITFNSSGDDLLTSVKNVMPTTPTSYLGGSNAGASSLASSLGFIGSFNCGLDTCYSANTSAYYDKTCLTDRGIPAWYWTFGDANAVINATKNGHLGLTNNAPDALSSYTYKVVGSNETTHTALRVGDLVNIHAHRFNGYTVKARGTVTYVEETSTGWNAIAEYTDNISGIKLFTQLFAVGKTGVTQEQHTITFMNGNQTLTSIKVDHNGNITYTAPQIDGYRFEGFFSDAQFQNPLTLPLKATANMTIYAKYTANGTAPAGKYTIKFMYGAEELGRLEVAQGDNIEFTAPKKSGYTFEGFFSDAQFENAVTLPMQATADMTIYAKYTANKTSNTTPSESGLSGGAIAGIVIGCVAGVALIAGLSLFFIKKRKK